MAGRIKVALNSKKLAELAVSGLSLRHPEYEFILENDSSSWTIVLDLEKCGQLWADEAHRLGVEAKIWDFLH